jgi:nucleoside-diphosphate-sugar epimerase
MTLLATLLDFLQNLVPLFVPLFRFNYFSDMRNVLTMARRGIVLVFGGDRFHINPVHGKDVVEACVSTIHGTEWEVGFGGPSVYTHREIAEAAFRALGKAPKILSLPTHLAKFMLRLLRMFTSFSFYGPIEFTLTILTRDMIGEA